MLKNTALFLIIISFSSFAQNSTSNPSAGIVISKTSYQHHWGVTQMSAHGWGGVMNLAGIPYKCFFVEDISSEEDLRDIDCLVFSQCGYLNSDTYKQVSQVLKKYLTSGGNVIIDGPIGYFDENTKERNHSELDEIVGVNYEGFYGDPDFRIKVKDNNHFITRNFSKGDFITQHIAGGLNIQKFKSPATVLLELSDERSSYPFLSVNQTSSGRIILINDFATWSGVPSIFRNIHPQVFNSNYTYDILIETVYYAIYGDISKPFPSLQVTNADITAIVRLDADASGNLNAQIQTINYLIDVSKETGVVPVYAWVASTAAKSGWQDIAPLGKKLEQTGGQIATHSNFHNIDQEMTEQRWKEELDDAIREIEFNMADYGYDIGKVDCFINPGNTIHMSDYNQVAKRFGFYMTHGFEQDMPIGFGNFTWFNEDQKNFVVLENTPSPDYQWFYDPTWSYTTQQITAYQENIFDHLYNNVGRGVIFNQMWHDYSITSQPQYGKDRIINKNNLAMYDAVKAKFRKSDLYAPEPEDLRNKLCIMAQSDYKWSSSGEEINMHIDLSRLTLDSAVQYTGGMGVRVNNTYNKIKNVFINGNEHYAFNDDVVILPDLKSKSADIRIVLGEQTDEPRLKYISKRLTGIEKNPEGLDFNIKTNTFGKFTIKAPDNFILLNADSFELTLKEEGELRGFVNSDRKVSLRKLKPGGVSLIKTSLRIADYSEDNNSIKMKISAENGKELNDLIFTSGREINKIVLGQKDLNMTKYGDRYTVTIPTFRGENELIISFKE